MTNENSTPMVPLLVIIPAMQILTERDEPMPKTDFQAKMSAAVKRVENMDKIDGHDDRSIGTIVAALTAGLTEPTNDAAYDALVMLADIRASIDQKPILNVMSLKTLYEALDAGGRVSVPDAPAPSKSDPKQN